MVIWIFVSATDASLRMYSATYMNTRSQEISNLRQWDKVSDMSW
jgi:hypothetical protein